MVWEEMRAGFVDIIKAPFVDLSVIWLLAPIFILWVVLELYFDTHKKERLGWNTALGNGISMFWITVNLMRYLFSNGREFFTWPKFGAVSFILLYALFISVTSFKHTFNPKVTYLLASPTPVYFLSGVAILWAYGSLTLSWWIILDLAIIFVVIMLMEIIIRHFMPESEKDDEADLGDDFKMGGGDDLAGDMGGNLGGGMGDLGTGGMPGPGGNNLGGNQGFDDIKF